MMSFYTTQNGLLFFLYLLQIFTIFAVSTCFSVNNFKLKK